jgi:hypothetical protein
MAQRKFKTFSEHWVVRDMGYKTPCWIWQGHINPGGYGQYFRNYKYVMAHKEVYEYFGNKIPTGMELDHLCKITCCVNPKHQEPVTGLENKHRSNVTKLTKEQVVEIRNTPYVRGVVSSLAQKFGVGVSTVSAVRTGQNWK